MGFRTACLVLTAFAGVTLPATGQDVPASSSTITTERQQSSGSDFSEVIYVSNHSTHTVIVTSIRLMDCENVQGNCGTRRMKYRIPAGGRTSIQRVRPRSPDQPFGFSYSFTWEQEAAEGPTAKDVEKDSAALVVDTLIVMPKLFDIKVGETVDLAQILRMKAMNAAGQELTQIYFYTRIALGEDFVTLEGTRLTGKAAGTAALLISASTSQSPVTPTKGATRILVQITP